MEKVILKCNDYSIIEVGLERLYDIVSFIVNENYNHHSIDGIPHNINDEIDNIYDDEVIYSPNALYYVVIDKGGKMIDSIRTFKWDKSIKTPMEKYSIFRHWKRSKILQPLHFGILVVLQLILKLISQQSNYSSN